MKILPYNVNSDSLKAEPTQLFMKKSWYSYMSTYKYKKLQESTYIQQYKRISNEPKFNYIKLIGFPRFRYILSSIWKLKMKYPIKILDPFFKSRPNVFRFFILEDSLGLQTPLPRSLYF